MSSSDQAERRSQIGRLGAAVLHSQHDSKQLTEKARATFLSRFERDVDPDLQLDPVERARRAEHAKTAYFLRLAMRSAEARRKGVPK